MVVKTETLQEDLQALKQKINVVQKALDERHSIEAERFARNLIREYPHAWEFWEFLGQALHKQRRHQAAEVDQFSETDSWER